MSRPGPAKRHVLALYRTVIRKSRNVPDPSLAADVRRHARDEIDKSRGLDPLDLQLIEHLMRRGMKQLELVESGSVKSIHVTDSS